MAPRFSHYVAPFISRSDPRAVCGAPLPVQHASEPSCPRCSAWLEADADGQDSLEWLWARERARVAGMFPAAWRPFIQQEAK